MVRRSYYVGTRRSPHHLSVGAVVLDPRRRVLCHHYANVRGKTDVYLLMRKTLAPGESLERTVARGLAEEFGVRGKITRFLGVAEGTFTNWERARVRKTTLYFLVAPRSKPTKRTSGEPHYGVASEPVWRPVPFLVRQMRQQAKVLARTDFDESGVLERI